jgi:uncharacterized protein (DUF885 family)
MLVTAQALPTAPSVPGMPPAPSSLEDRRKALAQVTHDYWEDVLKHTPELASSIGDTRFNDYVTDYTPSAFNDAIAREQGYLMQLAVIDLAGFSDQEKRQQEALEQRFEQDQKAADAKPWETPINASANFYAVYPQLAQLLPFASVKDYDDWTSRLHMLPEAFAQAMQDMSLGMDEGRMPPKEIVERALADVSALGHQKAEDSPLAAPLKEFPSNISATEQERIRSEVLDAITNNALPAYLRLERFLHVSYMPAAANAKGSAPTGTRDEQLLATVLNLRARAEQSLGPKFDVGAFREEVMADGLLPLDEMQKQVEIWIGNRSK